MLLNSVPCSSGIHEVRDGSLQAMLSFLFFLKQPDGIWVSLAAGETFSLILKLKLYQLMVIHYCKLEARMNTHMSLDE